MKQWQKIALNGAAVVGVALLVWKDPGYVVGGVDVLGWITELLFACLLGYGAVCLGRYAERKTGNTILGLRNPIGATFLVAPIAVLLHLGIQLANKYPLALYFDLRFGIFVAIAASAIHRYWTPEEPRPFLFLESGRRGSVAQTSAKGLPVRCELITVRRRVGDLVRQVEIDVRRQGWTPESATRWSRLLPSGSKETVSVSPGFFSIEGASQGVLDGGSPVNDPGSWSTVAFSTEASVVSAANPYDRM